MPRRRHASARGCALLDAAAIGPLRQAPGRTLLAVVAIALGVALGFSVYLINRVAADEVQLASRSLFGMADLSVQAPGLGFDEALYPTARGDPGHRRGEPGGRGAGAAAGSRPLRSSWSASIRSGRRSCSRRWPRPAPRASQGNGLLAEDAVWLSPAAAQMLDLDVGDTLDVQVALDAVPLRVAGLLPAGEYRQPLGMLDIGTAQWRLDRLGRLDRVDLRLDAGADPLAVQDAIRALLPPGVRLTTPGEASDDAVRLSRAYRSNLTALALVALFTGGVPRLRDAVAGRRAAPPRDRAAARDGHDGARATGGLAAVAAALVGTLGAALGVVLGIVVARAGLAAFGADLGAGYFRGVAPQLAVRSARGAWRSSRSAWRAALVATLGPAREAASVPAAAALKAGDEAPLAARRHGWIAARAGDRRPASRCCCRRSRASRCRATRRSPACCSARCSSRPRCRTWPSTGCRPPGPAWLQIATAQLRGTARRSTVSIAAVLVSFSLMVAMAIMVYSFRNSLDAWMQRILPADLYVRAGSAGLSELPRRGRRRRVIRGVDGVARVDFVRFQDVAMPGAGLPLTVIARPIDEDEADSVLPIRRARCTSRRPQGTVPVWASEAALDLRGFDVGTVFDLPLGGQIVRPACAACGATTSGPAARS